MKTMKVHLLLLNMILGLALFGQSESECSNFKKGKFKYKDLIIIKMNNKQIEKDVGVGSLHFDVVNFGECETYLIYDHRKNSLSGNLNDGDTIYSKLIEVRNDTFVAQMSYNTKEFKRVYIKIK